MSPKKGKKRPAERHRIDVEYAFSEEEDEIEIRMKAMDGAQLTGQVIMDAIVDMLSHMRTGVMPEGEGPTQIH